MNPFHLYHELGPDGVPWAGGERVPCRNPGRLKSLIYGFANQAAFEAVEFARAGATGGGA
jgi:hypothetical protein